MKLMKLLNTKRILLAILVIFILLMCLEIKRYYRKGTSKYLDALGLIEQCSSPGNVEELFSQEGINYKTQNSLTILDSLHKLSNLDQMEFDQVSKIPLITHKVYFMPEDKKSGFETFYIEEMKINFLRLNSLEGKWQHNVWVNRPEFIPAEIRNIKGVQIRDITEFKNHVLYNDLIDLIKKGNSERLYLAEASDLLRLIVLQKIGGIYSDMDYEIYNPIKLFELMHKFDFIGGREHVGINSYYGNAFIATKPNHSVLNEAIMLSIRNRAKNSSSSKPYYIKHPCNSGDALYFNGPPLITIAYFKKNNLENNRDIILPPWMIYNASFARYKNKTCKIELITKKAFEQGAQNTERLLEEFVINPSLYNRELISLPLSSKNGIDFTDDYYYNDNIFYNIKDRKGYDIIGGDMFCGTWSAGQKVKKFYYSKFFWR